jgi:hypothetical protein
MEFVEVEPAKRCQAEETRGYAGHWQRRQHRYSLAIKAANVGALDKFRLYT